MFVWWIHFPGKPVANHLPECQCWDLLLLSLSGGGLGGHHQEAGSGSPPLRICLRPLPLLLHPLRGLRSFQGFRRNVLLCQSLLLSALPTSSLRQTEAELAFPFLRKREKRKWEDFLKIIDQYLKILFKIWFLGVHPLSLTTWPSQHQNPIVQQRWPHYIHTQQASGWRRWEESRGL